MEVKGDDEINYNSCTHCKEYTTVVTIPICGCGDNDVCNRCIENYKCCCVCQEYDRSLAMISCDFCKEGWICIECSEKMEEMPDKDPFTLTCPCCRSILISHSLRQMVVSELLYTEDPKSNLMKRWKENFYNSSEYMDVYKMYE